MKIGNVNLTENGSFMVSENGKTVLTDKAGRVFPARIDATVAYILCEMQDEIDELKEAAGYEPVAVHVGRKSVKAKKAAK